MYVKVYTSIQTLKNVGRFKQKSPVFFDKMKTILYICTQFGRKPYREVWVSG